MKLAQIKITKNTDSTDIDQKCIGLDASRAFIPADVRSHVHKNRGLHIQIRHNGDKQTFARASAVCDLIAAAPEMLEALEAVRDELLSMDVTLKHGCTHPLVGLLLLTEQAIRRAKGGA